MATSSDSVLSTLGNGLKALEALGDGETTLRVLGERLELPRQTVYRVVHTLIEYGWVKPVKHDDGVASRYALTTLAWSLGTRALGPERSMRDRLAIPVRDLADRCGETVHLALYEGGEVVYLDKADGWQPIRAYTVLGGRAPAHCVATGKALLAVLPEDGLQGFLRRPLVSYTSRTITEPALLETELADVRRRGYAVNGGEWREDVGGVAVAVPDAPDTVPLALGFAGPRERIISNAKDLAAALSGAVAKVRVTSSGLAPDCHDTLADAASQ